MLEQDNDQILNSIQKIKYFARRGMLELDIVLRPYLDNCYIKEGTGQKKLFIEFLASEDNDMFDWLLKGGSPPVEYQNLITKIIKEKETFNKKLSK